MSKTIKSSRMSKIDKLQVYLNKRGNFVTEKMAASRFGLKNLRATISDLREKGMSIKTTKNGEGVLRYVRG